MSKIRILSRCTSCGHTEPRWMGRCPACHQWGSMAEEAAARGSAPDGSAGRPPAAAATARPVAEVPFDDCARLPTGISEFDRVLGGGLVPGSVALVGGEPGAGKSTLLLQAAQALAVGGHTVLYVSAEESPGQVRIRAERLAALHQRLLLASATDVLEVVGLVAEHRPGVLVLDSIQTVRHPDAAGIAGGATQVRECAGVLVAEAKASGVATVLVGHVTKEGQLAGPRVLEHLVDAVLDLSGDRHHALRLLRATKNRFGSAGEVGCFEMTGRGLAGVDDAGRLFLGDSGRHTTGVAVTLTLEGQRPLACEVQGLVTPTPIPNPRRVAIGLDGQRLALLVAVLERRARINLRERDVYVATVGGVRISEPCADLAVALAVASSCHDRAVDRDLVAIGEVGLAGDLRLVPQTERRLAEAARLGFRAALLPGAYDGADHGLRLVRAGDLEGALALSGQR